jgi:trans-2,3-dihydro-3-hydroxyanthranilate isomerase
VSLAPDDINTQGDYAIEAWSAGVPFLVVPLRSRSALARARINMDLWEKFLRDSWAPEVFVFVEDDESLARNGVKEGNGIMRARMFAPTLGIPEDPATGGAATAFGGYLAARSPAKDGLLRCTVHQGVEMGRPSLLEVEVDLAGGGVTAVRVGGASVLVMSGELHV